MPQARSSSAATKARPSPPRGSSPSPRARAASSPTPPPRPSRRHRRRTARREPRSSRHRTAPGRRSSCSRAAGRTGATSGRSCRSSWCRSSPRTGRSRATTTSTPRCRRTHAPQVACSPSARRSSPVVAGQGTAYASGLSPAGRLIASAGNRPFYGRPLVAWLPAPGADTYEVEWSRSRYPWRAVKRVAVDGGTATTAAAQARHVVVPDPRHQQCAARRPPVHELVSPAAADRGEAEVPARRLPLEQESRRRDRLGSGLA